MTRWTMAGFKTPGVVFAVLLLWAGLAEGQTWTPLANTPSFNANTALLLTDGTVMVQDTESPNWWLLTPDQNGSYVNGTWKVMSSMAPNYGPLYHASAVLPDGRVIIEGGEYNLGTQNWTKLGEIYDPTTDKWTAVTPPAGWSYIGDAQSIVLANGTFMLANSQSTQQALLNAKTLTWTSTGTGKFDINDEEGWTLLHDGTVLTVDAYVNRYSASGTHSERYTRSTGAWASAGSTVVQLWDAAWPCGGSPSYEVGPAVLRPNGTVFATGANSCGAGHTAIYNTSSNTWAAGPDIPNGDDIADGPAALLPNGTVLIDTSPGIYQSGTRFYIFDGKKFTEVAGPPNSSVDSSYNGSMLVLPTGQILFTDCSPDVEIFTASRSYKPEWAPTIATAPSTVVRGNSYQITGTQFNGLSQGAAYGDDAQSSTNYPLVRITNNATGHVFYARTHDHSTMAVATKAKIVATHFQVSSFMETGASTLVVVANGIPSAPVVLTVD